MFDGPIARRVKTAMKERIAAAEKEYSQEKKTISEERDVKVQEVEVECEMRKKKAEDSLVQRIIG